LAQLVMGLSESCAATLDGDHRPGQRRRDAPPVSEKTTTPGRSMRRPAMQTDRAAQFVNVPAPARRRMTVERQELRCLSLRQEVEAAARSESSLGHIFSRPPSIPINGTE
jgi:hypothetical protein